MRFNHRHVHGIVVPIITPLRKNETVDETALIHIVQHLLRGGVHGIFVNSTTGEGVCLLEEERWKVLQIVRESVDGKIPVYAGVSDNSIKRVLQNLEGVQNLGADIAVAHPPFYYPPNSQEELFLYFKEISRASKIPLMLYNIPSTTQASISLETIQYLMDFENVIGIKDSSVDFIFLQNLIELKKFRPDFKILIGKSNLWAAGMLSGADGGLDGISNLIPGLCVQLYNRVRSGGDGVFELQKKINAIWKIYECRSFLGGLKAAMSFLGLCRPFTSRPILSASKKERENIRQLLIQHGILGTERVDR